VPQIASIEHQRSIRSPTNQKISSALRIAFQESQTGVVNADAPLVTSQIAPSQRVLVDIDANVSDDLLNSIRTQGGGIVQSYPHYHTVRAELPLQSVEKVAELPDVKFIQRAIVANHNANAQRSEGDFTHSASDARRIYRVDGSGVKIGVISDSIDRSLMNDAIEQGKINNDKVTVLSWGQGTSEGLAMLEIIHDLAPGANLYFASDGDIPPAMAEAIDSLVARGCRIIVDDVTFPNESPFQDGPVAQAVARASDAGVLYFSSARNSGNEDDGTSSTWEGDFLDGGTNLPSADLAAGNMHAFTPGVVLNQIIAVGHQRRVDLFWSDPLGASTNQYDLYELDQNYNVVHYSTDTKDGHEDPYQTLSGIQTGHYIAIVRTPNAAPRYLHLNIGDGILKISTPGCVRGHNASNAKNAFSVAATPACSPGPYPNHFNASAKVETFSSDGPRRIFFNSDGQPITPGKFDSSGGVVVMKPDLTAADGVHTAVLGFSPFFGTSAAAPHAAAVAALVLSFRPSLTPAEVREVLTKSCINIMGTGWNREAGNGIVMALEAMQEFHSNAGPAH
jgi:subtilisin family serine protease